LTSHARSRRSSNRDAASLTVADDATSRFHIEIRPDRQRVIVAPVGELDLATVDELESHLEALTADGWAAIVLDLRGLSFIDSIGLSLIIRQTSRRDARVEIIDGSEPVARLFDVAGLREYLPFIQAS
jgi:anti-anti-sigma factor